MLLPPLTRQFVKRSEQDNIDYSLSSLEGMQ